MLACFNCGHIPDVHGRTCCLMLDCKCKSYFAVKFNPEELDAFLLRLAELQKQERSAMAHR